LQLGGGGGFLTCHRCDGEYRSAVCQQQVNYQKVASVARRFLSEPATSAYTPPLTVTRSQTATFRHHPSTAGTSIDKSITEHAGWSTLTTYDKPDRQTFVGGTGRPIGFGPTLCMSDNCERTHGPGIVDVISAAGGRRVGRASRATGHASVDTCLHSSHACLFPRIMLPSRDERN